MSDSSFVTLGVITSAHGVRGAVKIKPFTQSPNDLLSYGILQDKNGTPYPLTINGESKGLLICTIVGITDRNQVDALRGLELGVPRAALPDTDANEYYVNDLIGIDVFLADGSPYGTVSDMLNYGAGDIAEIALADGKTELVSFTHAVFPVVDLTARRMEYHPPERIIVNEEQ